MPTSKAETILNKIIEYGAKVEAITPILFPAGLSVPYLGVGLQVVKFIAGEINAARASNDPEVVLPPDNELIDRLEATAKRIEQKGQSFLDQGDQEG